MPPHAGARDFLYRGHEGGVQPASSRRTRRCWRSAAAKAICWRRCPTRAAWASTTCRMRSSARGPATPTSASRSATRPRAAGARIGPAAAGTWDAVICDRLCHSVLDIKALLTGLKRQMAPGGRVYLTAFNYLWELPVRLAEMTGWKRPAPTSNWLSDSDFRNLFDIVGLEVVRYEDRLLLPLEVPGVSTALNRYLVRAPGMQFASHVPDLRAARSRHRGGAAAGQRQRRRADAQRGGQRRGRAGAHAGDGHRHRADLHRRPFDRRHLGDDPARDQELQRAAEAERVPADGEGEGRRRAPRLRARRPGTS